MRDGKNFRRWFRYEKRKPHIIFGITHVIKGISSIQSEYIKSFTMPVPSIHEGGIVNGPQLAIIGDDPNRKEYILPSEILDKL